MNGLIKIEFPKDKVLRRNNSGSEEIFDAIRKTWVALTPEEWVRQHFIMYLIAVKKYPDALFAVEKEHIFNDLTMRADLVIYTRDLKPWMICEFKAADVPVSPEAFYQIGRYNLTYDVPYLVVSNGMEHYCMKRVEDNFEFLDDLPEYEQ